MSTKPFEGRVILVTGASRGIGLETARLLANRGAHVILSARDQEALDAAANAIIAEGGQATCIVCDFSDPASAKMLFQKVSSLTKRLDGLVNNAGVLIDGAIGTFTRSRIESGLAINLIAAMECLQFAARLMLRHKSGSIVNTASIMGTVGSAGQFVYGSAKAGIVGLTKSSAQELGPHGIRVNCISPGLIETEMVQALNDKFRQDRIASTALRRMGHARDVAAATAFLLSDDASFITGHTLDVDGGLRL